MTNLEAIKELIRGNANVPDEALIVAAVMAGIVPGDTYDPDDQSLRCKIYKLAIREIQRGVSSQVKQESEVGYSKTYAGSDGQYLANLAFDSGCADLIAEFSPKRPKIKSVSHLW